MRQCSFQLNFMRSTIACICYVSTEVKSYFSFISRFYYQLTMRPSIAVVGHPGDTGLWPTEETQHVLHRDCVAGLQPPQTP